ncbi:MAG: VanW family protein [Bowdeniella nasicola]|nr:VanW family protein [Bowdeniella nasicola]
MSELDQAEEETRPWYRKSAVIVGAVIGVLLIAYLVLATLTRDRVPANTTVAGVELGGMSAAQAHEALDAAMSERLAEPLEVAADEASAELIPKEAGLGVDVDATVSRLTGFTLNPRVLYERLTGGGEAEAVTTVDDDALVGALNEVSETLAVPPIDADVVFDGGDPVITEPKEGTELDVQAAADVLAREFLTAEGTLELPVTHPAPDIGEEELETVRTQIIEPLTSGPVTVKAGEHSAELSVEDLSLLATVDMAEPSLTFDPQGLREIIIEKAPGLGDTGKEARIVIDGGKPVVVPSTVGMSMDEDDLVAKVSTAATSTDRVAEVEMTEAEPEFNTEAATKLGVKEVVGEFNTPLTADRVRTKNLQVGTSKITNTLVKPGETFSLLQALGPVTYERGFVDSGVVDGGFATKALGGGLSQLSTTTMNAAFFAGMDLVEFRQHTRYFSRYPEGREATLWGPSLDMKWKNSTDYGVLVQAFVANNRVHVRLWSTKVYDVKSWTSKRRNITQPQVVYNSRPNCTPEHGTTPGFTVDFGRERIKDGVSLGKESWTWTYNAWPIVRCGSPSKQ